MKHILRVSIILLGLLVSVTACGDKNEPNTNDCDVGTAVSYNADVKAIFNANCTSCHSTSSTNRRGAPMTVNLDTYTGALASGDRSNARIQAGTMPPSGVTPRPSPEDACVVAAWVEQGKTER